jgi:hypothetical protein
LAIHFILSVVIVQLLCYANVKTVLKIASIYFPIKVVFILVGLFSWSPRLPRRKRFDADPVAGRRVRASVSLSVVRRVYRFFRLAAKIGFHLIDELKAKDFDIRQAKRDEKREEFYRISGRR